MFQSAVQEMIATKKEMEANRKSEKESRWIEIRAMEERKVAIEEEKLRVLGDEAQTKKMKQEYKIMFMDTTGLDEKQRAYVESMRAQILSSRMSVGGSGSGNGSV